jgi:glycosyltransferase involved in cell wall biosynthesis
MTYIPYFSFNSIRYNKLLTEFAKLFEVYVLAGVRPRGDSIEKAMNYKVLYMVPFYLPGRVRQIFYPIYRMLMPLNIVRADVLWLIGKTGPPQLLITKQPIVLDIEDPRITLPAGEFHSQPKLYLVNELRLLRNRRVRKVVVPTEMIKRKFIALGLDEDRISVIPNGVDTSLFHPTPLPKEPVVLYYGTFHPIRAKLLLEVVGALVRRRQDVRFVLLGDIPPSVRNKLLRVAGNRVEMPGFVEHGLLPQYIQKARVCIFPQDRSLGRGGSLKLIEYSASGRPIVATNVDESFPLKESGAGIVTDTDAEEMAEAIIRLLDDDKLAEKLARKGVEYAQKYNWNKIVEDYVRLFYQIYYNNQ